MHSYATSNPKQFFIYKNIEILEDEINFILYSFKQIEEDIK